MPAGVADRRRVDAGRLPEALLDAPEAAGAEDRLSRCPRGTVRAAACRARSGARGRASGVERPGSAFSGSGIAVLCLERKFSIGRLADVVWLSINGSAACLREPDARPGRAPSRYRRPQHGRGRRRSQRPRTRASARCSPATACAASACCSSSSRTCSCSPTRRRTTTCSPTAGRRRSARPHRPRPGGVLRAVGLPHRAPVRARLRARHAQAAAALLRAQPGAARRARPSTSSRSSCCCASASTARSTSGAREHEQRGGRSSASSSSSRARRAGPASVPIGPAWSIGAEVGFYILIPIAVLGRDARRAAAAARPSGAPRSRSRRVGAVMVVSIALRAVRPVPLRLAHEPAGDHVRLHAGRRDRDRRAAARARACATARGRRAASPGARSRCSALLAVAYARDATTTRARRRSITRSASAR